MASLDDIFLNARELGDPTERAAYLAQACGADTDLRSRVEAPAVGRRRCPGFFRS